MNLAAPVPVTAPEDASVRRESWSRLRWGCYVLLAFAAHVGLIFIFGSRKPVTPRAVVNAPRFQLASRHNEMLALADPTLFALPHARGFAAAAWEQLPRIEFVPFRWTEPPQVLALPSAHLGSAFIHFAETNVVPPPVLETLPPPQPSFGTTSGRLTSLRQYSRLMRGGDLAQRDWLTPPAPLPSWPANDLLTNSVVRVVVDAEGRVFSAVLLPPGSGSKPADQSALDLARAARFSPLPENHASPTLGFLIFEWHTAPLPETNTPAAKP